MRTGTVAPLAQCGAGTALLLAPQRTARVTATPGGPPAPAWLARVLGGRQLLQGSVTLLRPSRRTLTAGAAVDALHALSMVAVAAAMPRYRRPAVISAAFATAVAALGLRSAQLGTP